MSIVNGVIVLQPSPGYDHKPSVSFQEIKTIGPNHRGVGMSSGPASGQSNASALPYGQSSPTIPSSPILPLATPSTAKDAVLVLFTVALIGLTVFFTIYFWRKYRDRTLASLYKLDDYRYSRLSQNELDVDSAVFFSDSCQHSDVTQQTNDCDDVMAPATLHVETDSLITISNCTSVSTPPRKNAQKKGAGTLLDDDMSDEDLLQ